MPTFSKAGKNVVEQVSEWYIREMPAAKLNGGHNNRIVTLSVGQRAESVSPVP